MNDLHWERYSFVAQWPHARSWLTDQTNLGLAENTIAAYGRALNDYLAFSTHRGINPDTASREHILLYLRDLRARPNPRGTKIRVLDSGVGLANATLQQRFTAIRLYYDYLTEEGFRETNPVGRGRWVFNSGSGELPSRGLIPTFHPLPWIPTDMQWKAILQAARAESIRNRLMFAFAYDGGLRREEVCSIATGDIDPAHRLLHIRAETTKNRQARVVPYSADTGILYIHYLQHRNTLSRDWGLLFLSESHRNRAKPISIWTWSKVVQGIAARANVPQFTTHSLRHLCLTDLARDGWDIHEIATFAGHRSTQTTLRYIHLSGRDLADKIARGMAQIHSWRAAMIREVLV